MNFRIAKSGQLPPITGVLVPADMLTQEAMRAKGYRVGDTLSAKLSKQRNPRFHRLAHQIAALLVANVETFEGLDAHRALKRLQMESGIACDEFAIRIGPQMVVQRIPKSLAFDTMDDGEFKDLIRGICKHIRDTYWPDTTVEEIIAMAEEAERVA